MSSSVHLQSPSEFLPEEYRVHVRFRSGASDECPQSERATPGTILFQVSPSESGIHSGPWKYPDPERKMAEEFAPAPVALCARLPVVRFNFLYQFNEIFQFICW